MAEQKHRILRKNINKLVFVALVFLSLKLFTFAIEEFFPVFGFVLGRILFALLPFILAFILAGGSRSGRCWFFESPDFAGGNYNDNRNKRLAYHGEPIRFYSRNSSRLI
jgi:hypothetical protein